MRIWFSATLAALAAFSSPTAAQDDTVSEITATVDRFFDGLNSGDADAMAAEMTEEGFVRIVRYAEDGTKVYHRTFKQSNDSLRGETAKLNEVYWDPTIVVHRDIALFWAPYSIDVDGERLHCGIDSFDLVRIEGQWKIAALMYTAEPNGCPEGR